MNATNPPTVMVLCGSGHGAALVRHCAESVAEDLGAELRRVYYGRRDTPAALSDLPSFACLSSGLPEEAVRQAGSCGDIKMIVSDWPGRIESICRLLEALREVKLPAMLVRKGDTETPCSNALVLASGGPNITRFFRVSKAISTGFGLAPRLLCVDPLPHKGVDIEGGPCPQGASLARLVGLEAPLELCRSKDVLKGIIQRVRADDLVVLGGPNQTRIGEYFPGSIPDLISKKLTNDLVMLLGGKPQGRALRDIFWEDMVDVRMPACDRRTAVSRLSGKLLKNKQIPSRWRDYVLEKAMKREAILPTVTEAGTAFPHVTIPGLSGMVGALGLCPEGIDFGGENMPPARFVFLLLTPRKHYEEYLDVLSDIAAIMLSPHRRSELLQSRSPGEVLAKLEKYQKQLRPKGD